MTYEEALHICKLALKTFVVNFSEMNTQFEKEEFTKMICEKHDIEVMIKALEKQIPKKPIGDLHSCPHHRCPTCNRGIRMFCDDSYDNYCKYCGQAIRWE